MATVTLYLKSCDFSAWCNGGEDYATFPSNDRYLKGQFNGAGLNLTQYKITAIGIYGDYRRNSTFTYPMGNTNRGATLYNGSSISSMGSAVSTQEDGDSKMSNDYAGFTNYYTTDTNIINSLINQINSGLVVTINLHADKIGSTSSYRIYGKNIRLVVTYEEKPKYTVTVNTSTGGTVSGGGTYYQGATATVKATPTNGYKFKQWSDGNTSATRSVTVTGNATYTAYFEPIYILYDSIFSFKRWANTNLVSWDLINISNVTDTGFTGTARVDDAYTTECRPLIPVEAGKTYTFECTASGGGFEFFVFNCESSGAWSDFTYGNTQKFNFTPTKSYISIRCDVVGTGMVVNFSNFRIYPADCPYMSNSVSATDRTDVASWSMPTPTREGYTFRGWNTKPDGSGTTYTSSSAYPSSDLVLYSQWERSGTYYVLFSGYGATSGANSAPSAITATYGQSYTLPSPNTATFYKRANITWDGNADDAILNYTERNPNCTFIGWKRDPNTSTLYQPGESVNIEPTTEGGNVTFYATWQPATCEHPSATREGYKLKEWNTKADGSGTAYTGASISTLEDITLYAQWEEAKPKIKNVQMIYLDKQISATNKVPCGEGFIISVELS